LASITARAAGTNGKQIKVTGTATGSSVTVHTATSASGANDWDEVWLWANNTSTADVELVIEWGGATDPDNLVRKVVPAKDVALVIPGWRINNSLVVKAWSVTTANVINVKCDVNRLGA
jgi:hypothetical protein